MSKNANALQLEPEDLREIVITRLIDAAPEVVFEAWTDPKHVGSWWGPAGFSVTTQSIDVVPDGKWIFIMRGPDGRNYLNKITYLDVSKPNHIVYKHTGEDENGEEVFVTTITFVREGPKTNLTMRAVFPSSGARDNVVQNYGAIEGGRATLARLAAHISTMSAL
jgi:uncharacterized protein YndB with AHSA1/START domain